MKPVQLAIATLAAIVAAAPVAQAAKSAKARLYANVGNWEVVAVPQTQKCMARVYNKSGQTLAFVAWKNGDTSIYIAGDWEGRFVDGKYYTLGIGTENDGAEVQAQAFSNGAILAIDDLTPGSVERFAEDHFLAFTIGGMQLAGFSLASSYEATVKAIECTATL